MKSLAAITSVVMLMLMGARVQAVPCSDTSTGVFLDSGLTMQAWVNPDGCEDGAGSNDPFPGSLTFDGMTYDALQKINYANGGGQETPETQVNINLQVTPENAGPMGTWSFTNIAAYTDYIIVLKNGPTFDGTQWGAYLLDSSKFDSTDGSTWSGWWRYGCGDKSCRQQGQLKNLSHLTVYGKFNDGGGPPQGVPAPGTLLLLGAGLLGLRIRRRA